MDRESKIRGVLLLMAAAITAAVLAVLYTAQPINFYQVILEDDTPLSSAVSVQTPESLPSVLQTESELIESDPEGPQEVLVEKSININTATLEELDKLPGVGPVIAQRIIDYREQNNGFYDIQELMEVSGIGEKIFSRLEPYIVAE
ncbi:MAG: ComEA family DNA-binding protein [Acutalibacter sp.]|jgi:comEA protein